MSLIGQYSTLPVVNIVDFGVYLDAGDELGEVLLPKKYCPKGVEIDDELDVFIYLDSKDLPIATTVKPRATVGQFAYLKCTDENRFGAFLDWGLEKDVLVPFAEQHRPLEVGKSYLVYLYIDDIDHRITASSKVDKFLKDESDKQFKPRQKVELIIANTTDLGIKAIVNHSHWGLIHKSDIFDRLSFGQTKTGFIKQVRPDGRINLTFDGGQASRDRNAQLVIDFLNKNDGQAPFHDKSDPKVISRVFGISKAAFKKAIGNLYKNGDIVIESSGIKLKK